MGERLEKIGGLWFKDDTLVCVPVKIPDHSITPHETPLIKMLCKCKAKKGARYPIPKGYGIVECAYIARAMCPR